MTVSFDPATVGQVSQVKISVPAYPLPNYENCFIRIGIPQELSQNWQNLTFEYDLADETIVFEESNDTPEGWVAAIFSGCQAGEAKTLDFTIS